MVGRWGMSDAIGAVAVTDGRQDGALLPGARPTSAADPAARRRGGPPDRRRRRARRHRAARARARRGSRRWPTRCWSARRSTRPRPTRSRGVEPPDEPEDEDPRRPSSGRSARASSGHAAPRRPAPEPAPPPRPRARPGWGCPTDAGAGGVASPGVTTRRPSERSSRARPGAGRSRPGARGAADLVRADRPIAAVVHGVAGVGKTALLEAVCADARAGRRGSYTSTAGASSRPRTASSRRWGPRLAARRPRPR